MLGIIMARSKTENFKPLMQYGNLNYVKRTYINLSLGGIKDILVVAGEQAKEVEVSLSRMDAVFYSDSEYKKHTNIQSLIKAVEYYAKSHEYIIYSNCELANLSPETVKRLISQKGKNIVCYHEGILGNLYKLDIKELLDIQKDFENADKLFEELLNNSEIFDVEDVGVLPAKEESFEVSKTPNIRPVVKLSIAGEERFYGPGVQRLLKLVDHTGSVKSACVSMGISYSKAWKMIRILERELGFAVLIRQAGGIQGGESSLTEEGKSFMRKYEIFQSDLEIIASDLFKKSFENM